ncbi:hypothetical protein MMC09_002874 [Bachmanniomyces sp. S44760]|nr:hypothetical protein [Bachmanniomyces sp. S44760]
MRFSFAIIAASLASIVTAQSSSSNPFNIPPGGYLLHAGQDQQFTWKPTTSGTVSLILRTGSNGDLDKGTTIASSISNSGSYTYSVPSSTPEGNSYTIEIVSDSDSSATNYTPQFDILSPVKAIASVSGSTTVTTAGVTASTSSTGSNTASASTTTTGSDSTMSTQTTGSATTTASGSSSSGSSSSTTGSSSSSGSASTTSSASASAQSTAAPSGNAASGLRVQAGAGAGFLAVAMGVVAVV